MAETREAMVEAKEAMAITKVDMEARTEDMEAKMNIVCYIFEPERYPSTHTSRKRS